MQKTIDNDALGIMQFLATVYDREMSEAQLQAYVDALADLPEETLRKASNEWTRKQKWFPKIAELRYLAQQFSPTIKGVDDIVERLNNYYDRALDGDFVPEVWMKLILQLRVSDREDCADTWRKRYDHFAGDLIVDRHALAADWETRRYSEVVA